MSKIQIGKGLIYLAAFISKENLSLDIVLMRYHRAIVPG